MSFSFCREDIAPHFVFVEGSSAGYLERDRQREGAARVPEFIVVVAVVYLR